MAGRALGHCGTPARTDHGCIVHIDRRQDDAAAAYNGPIPITRPSGSGVQRDRNPDTAPVRRSAVDGRPRGRWDFDWLCTIFARSAPRRTPPVGQAGDFPNMADPR